MLNAAGAREKSLVFPGNHLIGVYGAGAFQTLVNRDLVRPSSRLFIVGGGNVGLIAGYHALQAGIAVVGLAEALPAVRRLQGPRRQAEAPGRADLHLAHRAVGQRQRARRVGDHRPRRRTLPPDARHGEDLRLRHPAGRRRPRSHRRVHRPGRRRPGCPCSPPATPPRSPRPRRPCSTAASPGWTVARALGAEVDEVPAAWQAKAELLKSHPGKVEAQVFPEGEEGVMPVIHCLQEIPCNPCSTVCPTDSIQLEGDPLLGLPRYDGRCIGCAKCVLVCPGLAITLVDYRRDQENPIVTVPYEMSHRAAGRRRHGQGGRHRRQRPGRVRGGGGAAEPREPDPPGAPARAARPGQARGRLPHAGREADTRRCADDRIAAEADRRSAMACLCERVSAAEVRRLIRAGVTDINQIKAVTRAGMGACGGKSCDTLIRSVFRQEGIDPGRIVPGTKRPLFVEVPLGTLAGGAGGEGRRMTMKKNYDVIVIGAGSVGVPAALALWPGPGLSVLVLDELASPGQLSNKKAIGGIRATHSDFGKISVCQRSIEIFAAWKEQRRRRDRLAEQRLQLSRLFPGHGEEAEGADEGAARLRPEHPLGLAGRVQRAGPGHQHGGPARLHLFARGRQRLAAAGRQCLLFQEPGSGRRVPFRREGRLPAPGQGQRSRPWSPTRASTPAAR